MTRVLAILACLCAELCAAEERSLLPERVNHSIQRRLADGDFPALVITVVDSGQSATYSFGKLDNGSTPDANTVFEIGSITKTFTALLLAEEATANTLKLDANLATLLPRVTIPSRAGKAITLEQLATQHSGLPRLPTNLRPRDPNDPYADYDGDKLKAFLANYALEREPGSVYEYSNLGVGLLGFALAEHAHTTYATLLQDKIFGPIGMRSSAITPTDAMREHFAMPHDEGGKPTSNWHFEALAAAGGINSTAADMLRYLSANMGLLNTPLYPAMELAHAPRADAAENERIGLAWMIRHDASTDVVWHNGMTGGYASFIGFTRDRRHGVVVLTNAQQSVDDLGFATLIADAPLRPVHQNISLATSTLDQYIGRYQLGPQFVLRVFRIDAQLYGQATGQRAFPIFAVDQDEFYAKVGDIRVSFQRDASGNVGSLVMHQGGDRIAPRLSDAGERGGYVALPLDATTLAGYVGHYRLTPTAIFELTLKDGQLLARLGAQSGLPIYAAAKGEFFYIEVDAQITFECDPAGKVVALVLHQGGMDQRAVRIDDK